MNEEEPDPTVIRAVRIREDLKPLIIHDEDDEPIEAEWAAIVEGGKAPKEWFRVSFMSDEGEEVESLSFETLEIALDQAKEIAGIDHDEWTECDVTERDGLKWDDVVP
jgi:hypothetical protein